MRVVCTELRDGEQINPTNEVPGPNLGEPAEVVLERKRQGALSKGYEVVDVAGGFDAVKTFENGVTKHRQFRIVQD